MPCVCVLVWLRLRECFLLTSDISKEDGLSVGVQELDDGVIIIFDSTADSGRLPLHHRDVVCHQVLALDCGRRKAKRETETADVLEPFPSHREKEKKYEKKAQEQPKTYNLTLTGVHDEE